MSLHCLSQGYIYLLLKETEEDEGRKIKIKQINEWDGEGMRENDGNETNIRKE
jgi:hypothetical protein